MIELKAYLELSYLFLNGKPDQMNKKKKEKKWFKW